MSIGPDEKADRAVLPENTGANVSPIASDCVENNESSIVRVQLTSLTIE